MHPIHHKLISKLTDLKNKFQINDISKVDLICNIDLIIDETIDETDISLINTLLKYYLKKDVYSQLTCLIENRENASYTQKNSK